MEQLRVLLITSQFELLHVVLLHWKRAVAMKVAVLENTVVQQSTYIPPSKLPLSKLNRKAV